MGDITKDEARRIAAELKLASAHKRTVRISALSPMGIMQVLLRIIWG